MIHDKMTDLSVRTGEDINEARHYSQTKSKN